MTEFNVSTPSINSQIRNLSGGNIQKLILGREISEQPQLLVASHPTYGLDVGATEFLRQHLAQTARPRQQHPAVFEDLEEILSFATGSVCFCR